MAEDRQQLPDESKDGLGAEIGLDPESGVGDGGGADHASGLGAM